MGVYMTVNIHDVAKKAGVSISSVSRVINNNYPVSKKTREKVERAIEELSYVPNQVARSLKTKRSFNIALVVPGITNPFFLNMGETIIARLKEEGFIVSLFNTAGDYREERNILENIIARNMDGIIIVDPSIENIESDYLSSLAGRSRLLVINSFSKDQDFNYISYDERIGILEGLRQLHGLGRDRILFIRGDRSLSYDLRQDIYLKFLEEEGLDFMEVLDVGRANSDEIIEITREKFRSRPLDFNAVLASNDLMAIGAIEGIKDQGYLVPEDVAVIGVDNILMSKYLRPRLSTVDLNMMAVGERAAEVILNLVKGSEAEYKEVYKTRLIVRETCS